MSGQHARKRQKLQFSYLRLFYAFCLHMPRLGKEQLMETICGFTEASAVLPLVMHVQGKSCM